jgi:hypothetical protein
MTLSPFRSGEVQNRLPVGGVSTMLDTNGIGRAA